MRSLVAAAAVALAAGCGPVRASYVRPDYEATDRLTLKRIGVYSAEAYYGEVPKARLGAPPEHAPPRLADLVARMAKRWVHDHKDYLVLRSGTIPESDIAKDVAVARYGQGLDGLLVIRPGFYRPDGKVGVHLWIELIRTRDAVSVYSVDAEATEASENEDLEKMAAVYVKALGPEVRPFVAPLFLVLRAALRTMPQPLLTDKDVEEKIFLDE